jgi:hypothetical protein
MPRVEMIGRQFGRLTVTKYSHTNGRNLAMWHCSCSCGSPSLVVSGNALRTGNTESCGCLQRERTSEASRLRLRGMRFGRLVVIEDLPIEPGKKKARWNCRCDCGASTCVTSGDLQSGHTQSCGCLGADATAQFNCRTKRHTPGNSGLNWLFSNYRRKAKERGREFQLTKDDFALLTSQPCYYCDLAPRQEAFGTDGTDEGKQHSKYQYNGLDRFDNNKGYLVDNVVPCCRGCNFAKRDLPADVFIELVLRGWRGIKAGKRLLARKFDEEVESAS